MKVAKSYKIVLLLTALIMCIAGVFSINSFTTVNASPTSVTNYLSGTAVSKTEYKEDNLALTGTKDETVSFKNKLVISDFAMELVVKENTAFTLTFASDSANVNGNENTDGKFDKIINNKLSVKRDAGTAVALSLNGGTSVNADVVSDVLTVKSTVANGVLSLDVNGQTLVASGDYYKIKDIDSKATATITFTFNGESATSLMIKSVDQKVSDDTHSFKQIFKIESDSIKHALPRVTLNDSFYKKNADGTYSAIKTWGDKYTLTLKNHSVMGSSSTSELFVSGDTSEIFTETGVTTPRSFRFIKKGDAISFTINKKVDDEVKVLETISVQVIEKGKKDVAGSADEIAPVYVDNAVAKKAFLAALKEATIVKNDDGTTHSAALGTDLDIPSLKDLVFDDVTPYEELGIKLTYKSRTTEKTVSKMSIDLDEVDKYIFYVSFTDANGNEMDETKFMKVNDDGSITYGDYEQYIFDFTINDDAPIEVKAPATQGLGYKGVSYKASKFNIDAKGCKLNYKLFYNSDLEAEADAEGWKEIPRASSVSKDYTSEDGFTYDEIKAFEYNGDLRFVPTMLGSYKIECTATSEVSSRKDEASSIIRVKSEPKEVKVDNHWLQNNAWSVTFLSIGTVCFIALIVLLCIKPKDKKDDE